MKATIDETKCKGCGVCARNCPAMFELSDGKAKVKITPIPTIHQRECESAEMNCDAQAITVSRRPSLSKT